MHGIYIHIPFCAQKCAYCDFLSFPGKHENEKKQYLSALENEIKFRVKGRWQHPQTIFIGGGTPTTLSADELARLLRAIGEHVDVEHVQEFTVEANPGTIDTEKLSVLKAGGVNRLSFGVQSFDDGLLKMIGRVHTAAEAKEAVRMAREAGFTNINLDLMYGLPGQTAEQWKSTIAQALALAPEHLSLYQLIPEPGTSLVRKMEAGLLPPVDEDGAAEWFEQQRVWLAEAGYHQYEISNYAREGFASKHNQLYWKLDDYLGLGLGATSWERPRRSENTQDFLLYTSAMHTGKEVPQHSEMLTRKDQMSESVFMALRMNQGLSLSDFTALYGCTLESVFPSALEEGERQGWLVIAENHLRLTERGRALGNWVFELFI